MESTVQSQELVAQLASIFETMPPTKIEDLIRSYEGTHTLDFYVDKILEKTIAETLAEPQQSEIQSEPAQTTDELVSTFEIVTPEQPEVQLPITQVQDAPIPSPIAEVEEVEEPTEKPQPADLKAALKRIKKLEKELKRSEKEKKKALNWAVGQVESMKVQLAQKDQALEEKDKLIQQQQQRIQTLIDERATVENNVFNILKTTAEKIKDGGNALARGVDVQLEKLEKELPSGNSILASIKSLLSDIAEGSKKFSTAANEKFVKLKEEFDVTKASMQSYIDELQTRLQRYQEQEAAPINMNNVEPTTQVEQPKSTDQSSQTTASQ